MTLPPVRKHHVHLIAAHEAAGTRVAYRQQAHLSQSEIHEPASMGVGHLLVDRRVVEIEAIGRCRVAAFLPWPAL